MKPSETMQVTGGLVDVDMASPLSLMSSSRKGAKKFCFLIESQSNRTSWVVSASESGRPSGMALNWKSGKPSRELGPEDFRKRLWLNSELTNVI
ncbi:unnamed protein product [Malus baccata var. baccata]